MRINFRNVCTVSFFAIVISFVWFWGSDDVKKKKEEFSYEVPIDLFGTKKVVNTEAPLPERADDNYLKRKTPGIDELKKQENYKKVFSKTLKLFELSNSGQWDEFLKFSKELNNGGDDLLNLALHQAISNNAPIFTIEELLNNGAEFQPTSIHVLTIKNNVNLTKEMIKYGLDIHGLNKNNENAIYTSLEYVNSKEMFDFLLSQGVSFNDDRQLSAIQKAVNLSMNNDEGFYFLKRLIENGAQFSESDNQKIELLIQSAPDLYKKINQLR